MSAAAFDTATSRVAEIGSEALGKLPVRGD